MVAYLRLELRRSQGTADLQSALAALRDYYAIKIKRDSSSIPILGQGLANS